MAIEPEVIEGPTPNGGVRSIAYWFDADGNPVEKVNATNVEIHEVDKDGGIIRRVYGSTGRGKDSSVDDEE